MSTVPVWKRQRAEQVVPTFVTREVTVAASEPDREEASGTTDNRQNDYPIPNFEALYSRMRDPDHGVKIEDRRWNFRQYSKCFIGAELVNWLIDNVDGSLEREDAVEMGQNLLNAGILHHVTKSESFADQHYFYRFQEDEETSILNMKRVWDSNRRARNAVDVSVTMITKLACLCEEHRRSFLHDRSGNDPSANDEDVDYAILAKSEAFRIYEFDTAELQAVDITSLDSGERLAFFINVYNTLCLHGHVVSGAPTHFFKRMSFFRRISYRLGGLDYTLDDIEHGILRGNKRPPSWRFMQQLRPTDPKCHLIPSRREERIHFVISAGTPSDPPIRIVDMENLAEVLHDATEEFLNMTVQVDTARKEITLPRIFSWYSEDFPRPESSMLRWVGQYLRRDLSAALSMLLENNSQPTVIYQNFDWTNSEARFSAAVVRKKRRRLERERMTAYGDRDGASPNLASPSPSSPNMYGGASASGNFGSPLARHPSSGITPPTRQMAEYSFRERNEGRIRPIQTPPMRQQTDVRADTPALSGASSHIQGRYAGVDNAEVGPDRGRS
eukprot:Plantae.Rhodophyta-Purpureofilum_apyrenoidigerum.ctg11204.p1 GENE.Plantae.Rhodophyta-Purpureofilum_apyrenoidigerum.ctg11204~~Plantae.Rhodophyta-Purpureofilum_apyrenoidigerum.ctg11204.p1  ORF type:complete len:557 (-),score=72.25 Plantae.Rhodophyta-Purpureofilum_apyrenoidigerum.ctg11204:323-1993(-)